jgi:integrase
VRWLALIAAAAAPVFAPAQGFAHVSRNPRPAEVIAGLKREGMPIGATRFYTPSSDPNHLLGRPGQYTGKANFKDRDPEAQLFRDVTADALRIAIGRACKACGVPVFSPHDLRHRRISLLHRQGRSWAEIARFVGQRALSITADTYTHVLIDGAEVDYAGLLD